MKKLGSLVTAPLTTAISPLLAATSSIFRRRRPGASPGAPRPDALGYDTMLGYDAALGYDTVLGYDAALGYDTVLGYDVPQRAAAPAVLSRSSRIPRHAHRVRACASPAGAAVGPGTRADQDPWHPRGAQPQSLGVCSANSPHLPPPADHHETLGLLRRMSALGPADGLRASLREAVIRDQMRHAWYITALYGSRGSPGEDEVTLAYRSLGMAVDGFDPEGGESFLRYAVPVILREVKASLRRNGAGDLASAHRTRQMADALRVSTEHLTRALGRSPTVLELAEATGEGCEQIVESLDAALGYTAPWIDLPELPQSFSEFDRYEERLRAAPNREALTALFATLENRAKRALLMWYLRGWSQAQIAAELGVSREQISRLHAQSLGLLGAAQGNPFSALADEPDTTPALAGGAVITAQTALSGPGLLAA